MAKSSEYSDSEIAEAMRWADFKPTRAARQLGMSPASLQTALRKREGLAILIEEYRVYRVNHADTKRQELVEQGYWPAIAYTLTKLGKPEGWGDTVAIDSGDNSAAIIDAIQKRYPPAPPVIDIPNTIEALEVIEVDT